MWIEWHWCLDPGVLCVDFGGAKVYGFAGGCVCVNLVWVCAWIWWGAVRMDGGACSIWNWWGLYVWIQWGGLCSWILWGPVCINLVAVGCVCGFGKECVDLMGGCWCLDLVRGPCMWVQWGPVYLDLVGS